MEKELVLRQADVVWLLRGVDYSISALLERRLELGPISAFRQASVKDRTKGIISVGWVVSLCASSSL